MVSCCGLLVLATLLGAVAALSEEGQRNAVLQQEEKLWRIYNVKDKVHYYNYNRMKICKAPAGHELKSALGHVVTFTLYHALIKNECPDLVKYTIYRVSPANGNPAFTHIGYSLPTRWANSPVVGEFYCAEKKGYCGANQPFYELNTITAYDMLYTDDLREAQSYQLEPKRVCYIWTTQPSVEDPNGVTVRQKLIQGKSTLNRVELTKSYSMYLNRISVSENETMKSLLPISTKRIEPVAYIVKECDYPTVKKLCPDLIRINVTQGTNKLTYLTKEGEVKPAGCPSPSFYCAPTRGYCGADKPILSIEAYDKHDISYPSNEWEINNKVCVDPAYKNGWTIHCYGWADDDYYKKTC